MLREFKEHGLRKGWRVWWTWASAMDITTITRGTRVRRWVWTRVFRQTLVPYSIDAAKGEGRDDR